MVIKERRVKKVREKKVGEEGGKDSEGMRRG